VLAPGAALAGTLDQQQTDGSGGNSAIFSGQSDAQTFTAGLSGGVDRVDLQLETVATPTAPLTVEIRNVSGGMPGTTVLASQSVPGSSVPGTLAFVPINFATSAPVVAGTQYAIVAYSSTSNGSPYGWAFTPNGASLYTGGAGFYTLTSPPSGAWSPLNGMLADADLAFKTYVVVPASTPPASTPPASTPPSNTFTFGKLKLNKKKGTALITVNTPGPGKVLLSGKGIKTENGATSGPQSYKLPVISKGKTKKKLRKTGKVKVKVSVTFTPTGGTPNTQLETIKLIKKR
jgi:hypothetical protein